ncbi:hypothetical protein D3C76_1607210 [compost metagenome]
MVKANITSWRFRCSLLNKPVLPTSDLLSAWGLAIDYLRNGSFAAVTRQELLHQPPGPHNQNTVAIKVSFINLITNH